MKELVIILCVLLEFLAAEKQGACPDVAVAKGENCDTDYECPGVAKCCDHTCVVPGDVGDVMEKDVVALGSDLDDDMIAALYAYDRSRPKRQAMSGAWQSVKTLRKAAKALRKKQRQVAKAIRLENKANKKANKEDKKKRKNKKKIAASEEDGSVTGIDMITKIPVTNINTMKDVDDDKITNINVKNQVSGQSKMTKMGKEEKKKLKQMKRAEKMEEKKQNRAEKRKQKKMKKAERLKKREERRMKRLEKMKKNGEIAGTTSAN